MAILTRRAPRSLRLVGAALFPALFVAAPATPQATPHTDQFLVNSYSTGAQALTAIASDATGRFIVVWASGGSSGNDNDSNSIQGRQFSPEGAPAAAEFQVNSFTTGSQNYSDAASDPEGRVVVVWESAGSVGDDNSGTSIQARRLDFDGFLGAQFQVNSFTTSTQARPAVAAAGNGDVIVVWHSFSSAQEPSGNSIQAQRFDLDGNTIGSQFHVNSYGTGSQYWPVVVAAESGNFVVAWVSSESAGTDTSATSIQVQRFDSTASPVGPQEQVNEYTTGIQTRPEIASDSAGNFVVTWMSVGSFGTDSSGYSIQARRFAVGGGAGSEFQVNTYTTNAQNRPAVARDPGGNFVIVWSSDRSDGPNPSFPSIRARRLFADGSPLGDEFRINIESNSSSGYTPDVDMDAEGNFTVAWHQSPVSGPEGLSIQARLFDALFKDGFELQGTARWSSQSP